MESQLANPMNPTNQIFRKNASQETEVYRLFKIDKNDIPNRFFRLTPGRFYKINNEIILIRSTINFYKKSSTGNNRLAIFFTESSYNKADLDKYLRNKKRVIKDLDSILNVTITQENRDFLTLVKYMKNL